jgi:hypothetical protein
MYARVTLWVRRQEPLKWKSFLCSFLKRFEVHHFKASNLASLISDKKSVSPLTAKEKQQRKKSRGNQRL